MTAECWKTVKLIACILFFGTLLAVCLSAQEKTDSAEGQVSVHLTELYKTADRLYFDNKLPTDVIVYLDDADGNMGLTTAEGKTFRIDINPKLNPVSKEQELTLYHEMCHVATDGQDLDPHGPHWIHCMHVLADEDVFDDLW